MNKKTHWLTLVIGGVLLVLFALFLDFTGKFGFSTLIKKYNLLADSITASVTVTGVVPEFSVAPAESTASTGASPTNVGTAVTFQGTATDDNGDAWKLLVCKTDGVTGIACDGGESDKWCVSSSSVASGSQNTCSYTTLNGDSELNPWYAYACDDSACSTVSQGSEDSGSPFIVNHAPAFSAYNDDSSKDPGQTVTWTTTSSDSDTNTVADTVTLYVCTTASFSGGVTPACGATEWCHSSASASNATCNYGLPSVKPDGNYNAYGYVVDSHGFVSSGASQGADSTLTVGNVSPSITASTISLKDTDGIGNLVLTTEQSTTSGFTAVYTVADNNSCLTQASGNEISTALGHVWRSGIGTNAFCDDNVEDNNNNCYAFAGTCTQDDGSCTDNTDSTATFTCSFSLQYHTDSTVASTQYPDDNWVATAGATDDDAAQSGLVDSTTGSNEMDTFTSYDLNTASIAYSDLVPGATSAEQTTILEATGNVGIDENLSGADMSDGATHTIAVGQQHYNLTASQTWVAGTTLTTDATEAELNCAKTTTTGSPATANTYWLLKVPDTQYAAAYSGNVTIAGILSEVAGW